MKDRWFLWMRHHQIADALALGWIFAPSNGPMHHHDYSFLMEWLCECKMRRPKS